MSAIIGLSNEQLKPLGAGDLPQRKSRGRTTWQRLDKRYRVRVDNE
jgi:hypothetical protein